MMFLPLAMKQNCRGGVYIGGVRTTETEKASGYSGGLFVKKTDKTLEFKAHGELHFARAAAGTRRSSNIPESSGASRI